MHGYPWEEWCPKVGLVVEEELNIRPRIFIYIHKGVLIIYEVSGYCGDLVAWVCLVVPGGCLKWDQNLLNFNLISARF